MGNTTHTHSPNIHTSMQRLFGRPGKAAQRASDSQAVLDELAENKELLEKREEHLQRKLQKELADALEHKKHDRKSLALGCLKRKKLIEEELSALQQQRFKLDSQEHALQQLRFNEATLAVERRATEVIQAKVKEMGSVEGLEDAREKTEETLEDAYEMLSVMAQPIAHPALADSSDADLLAELEALENEDTLEQQLDELESVGASRRFQPAQLPAVPQTKVRQEEERELAELEQLTASMMVESPMPSSMSAALHGEEKLPLVKLQDLVGEYFSETKEKCSMEGELGMSAMVQIAAA